MSEAEQAWKAADVGPWGEFPGDVEDAFMAGYAAAEARALKAEEALREIAVICNSGRMDGYSIRLDIGEIASAALGEK